MKKFAFVDVQNTETTALKVLKFMIDNERLFSFLKNDWNCEKVFFYPGIQRGDEERDEIFSRLLKTGAVVRPKYYLVYKNEDKIFSIECPKCNTKITQKVDMGYSWKCNCDVELTMDVLNLAQSDTEIILFTGDGDFELLIKDVIAKGGRVSIVSTAKRQQKGFRYSTSRFSTKLRNLTKENGYPVKFIELDNLKFRINKVA